MLPFGRSAIFQTTAPTVRDILNDYKAYMISQLIAEAFVFPPDKAKASNSISPKVEGASQYTFLSDAERLAILGQPTAFFRTMHGIELLQQKTIDTLSGLLDAATLQQFGDIIWKENHEAEEFITTWEQQALAGNMTRHIEAKARYFRTEYRRGTLSSHRIAIFGQCPLWKWKTMYQMQYQEFIELWADQQAAGNMTKQIRSRAGEWRKRYWQGKLTVETIEAFEQCPLWKWKVHNTLSQPEAMALVQAMGIKGYREYAQLSKQGKLPAGFHQIPRHVYGRSLWEWVIT